MASIVVPATFSATTLAVADLNTNIRDATQQLQGHSTNPKPFAIVSTSVNVNLTKDVFTQLTFDTTEVNRGSIYASNAFTIPTGWAGLYSVKGGCNFDSPSGNKEIGIFVNGSQVAAENIYGLATDAYARKCVSRDIWVSVGDEVTLEAFHDHPTDINALAGSMTFFSIIFQATGN